MNNLVHMQPSEAKYTKEQIHASLLNLKQKLPGAPDFNKVSVLSSWVSSIIFYKKEAVINAFKKASGMKFFPELQQFMDFLEERRICDEKERIECDTQAEKLFSLGISSTHTPTFANARKTFRLNDIACFWLEKRFKEVDEFKIYLHKPEFRMIKRKEIKKELEDIYIDMTTSPEIRDEIDKIRIKYETSEAKTISEPLEHISTKQLKDKIINSDESWLKDSFLRLVDSLEKKSKLPPGGMYDDYSR